MESERKSNRAKQRPQRLGWDERVHGALLALKGASRAWLIGLHSCLAILSSGKLLHLFVLVFSSVINMKIIIPTSSDF